MPVFTNAILIVELELGLGVAWATGGIISTPIFPEIRKAERLEGKSLVFRNATSADAAFILGLRRDPRKATHLSHTPQDLERQVAWLEEYATKCDQAYFVIQDQGGQALGTVRLYDPRRTSFCWGSWILKDGAPRTASIESALMVYAYAVDWLGFLCAHFDVRKGNESVWRFHERFGAERVREDVDNYYYEICGQAIRSSQMRYGKYLPCELRVVETNR